MMVKLYSILIAVIFALSPALLAQTTEAEPPPSPDAAEQAPSLVETNQASPAVEFDWSKYVGKVLLDKGGKEISVDTLKGKYVGIYLSASWCGPCRAFTPQLQAFHKKFKANFEVILVGSDRTKNKHLKYISKFDMDWLSMPYRSRSANLLARQFSGRGIPQLILINPEGEVITPDGRGAVLQVRSILQLEGDKLSVKPESYLCDSCTKQHQRLVFSATK